MTTDLEQSQTLTDFYGGEYPTDPADSASHFGSRLGLARRNAELSVEQLATKLGAKATSIAAWESGDRSPRSDRVTKLAGILGVSISWLLIGHGETPVSTDTDESDRSPQATIASVRQQLASVEAELVRLEQQLDSTD